MNRFVASTAILVAAQLISLSSPSRGVENPSTSPSEFQFQLNISNPGARSLALGGAFAGLADDATAAYANPAGLTNISLPEVSAEGRRWTYTNTFPDSGSSANPSMRLKMGHSSDSVTGISFLSYAYPAKRGAFAIYRQELANFEADVETHGPTFDFILQGQNLPLRFYPTRTKASISIINYGVSGAYRINDKLSLGVGLSSLESSYDQLTRRYDFDGAADVDFSDSNVVNTLKRSGGDRVTGFNVGFLWNAARTLSLGGVYRRRADFNLQEIIYETDSSGAISSSAGFTSTKFSIPTILALGVALKPNDQITVALELNRAKYSDIKFSPKGVRADDADEIHLGGEYVFVSPNYRVPLRLGAWHDPDHQPAFRGSVHEGDLDERVNALLFPRGKSQWHYAGGVGFAYSTKFQLDAGFDRSDSTKIFSLSAVYRF